MAKTRMMKKVIPIMKLRIMLKACRTVGRCSLCNNEVGFKSCYHKKEYLSLIGFIETESLNWTWELRLGRFELAPYALHVLLIL